MGRSASRYASPCHSATLSAANLGEDAASGYEIQAGYKWVSGVSVSSGRYGESLFQWDSYLSSDCSPVLPSLRWGGRPLRIATTSWHKVTSPPIAGMAELSWYRLPGHFEVGLACNFSEFGVLKAVLFRNRINAGWSPAASVSY